MIRTAIKPMRFQDRDGMILREIYKRDGMLSRRQIKRMFWPNASTQAMDRRLLHLRRSEHINMPSVDDKRFHANPEPIVWLGWRGLLCLAAESGLDPAAPVTANENQLRKLETQARQAGIHWKREPRWSQLSHDIAVNDFRYSVEKAVEKWPSLTMDEWLPEGEFFRNMDTIELPSSNRKRKKGIRPDGFFVLVDHLRQINNSPAKARFLLELDNSTHPLDRFGLNKALPGLAYIRSDAYRRRFGFNSGRWLVVCKSQTRLFNLKQKTEKVLGKQSTNFLFTTLEMATPDAVLNRAIWWRGTSDERVPLIEGIGVDS